MNITKAFKNYFFLFFLSGQSSCIAVAWRCSRSRTSRIIPAFVYFLATIAFTVPLFMNFRQFSTLYEKESGAVFCLIQCLSLLIAITSVVNTVFYNNEIRALIYSLDRIITYLERESNERMADNVLKFKRAYARKFKVILMIWALHMTVFVVTSSLRKGRVLRCDVLTCIVNFYTVLAKVHILFYVDLMIWCYELNTKQIIVNNDYTFVQHNIRMERTLNVKEFTNTLRHCKYVHFKLWKISNLINSHFGGTMTILLVISFTEGLLALFWLFLYLRQANFYNLPRK